MRLTEVFKVFVAAIATVGAELCGKVADIVVEALGEPSAKPARTLKGVPFHARPVDLGRMGADLLQALRPEAMTQEAKDLAKALHEEINRRGADWAETCLADALDEHLVKPLRAAHTGGAAVAPPAKPAKAGKKAA